MIYHNNNKIIKAYQNGNLVNKIDKVVSGGTPSSRLPSGYTEVEYIENTSTAYINTNLQIYSSTTNSFEVKMRVIPMKHNSDILQNVFSCMSEQGEPYQGFSYRYYYDNLNMESIPTRQNTFNVSYNEDSTQTVIVTSSSSQRTYTHTYPLSIFCGLDSNKAPFRFTNTKLYECDVKLNDVLIMSLVPCKNPNNVVGAYDIINDVFFSSPNNVAFTAGSPITPSTAVTSESKTIFQYVVNEVEPTPPTPIDYSKQYLTTVALTDNVTFTLTGGNRSNTFQYSTDSGETWNNIQIGQTTTAINNGEKMYWKASSPSINNELGIGTIWPSASANVEGNIMSLKYGDNFSGETALNQFQFRKLFSGATHIVSAENMVLPSTTFQKQCYSQMFQGCTSLTTAPTVIGTSDATFSGDYSFSDMFANCSSLTTAPQLPMTSLGKQCYWYMLQNCTSLTTAPLLPATSLLPQCYCGMFNGCTSLNSVTCLATTNITSSNCNEWLKDVAASGTFTKAANASWSTTGQNGIPNGWTVVDYSE